MGKIKASLEEVSGASKVAAIGAPAVSGGAPAVKQGCVDTSVSVSAEGGVGAPTVPGGGVGAPSGTSNVGGGELFLCC